MVSNVDYYVAGFDASGKRVGSLIFNGRPDDSQAVADAVAKGKAAFDDAVVVEVINADDYGMYLSGDYVRGADGTPVKYVAPEPTEAEKKADQQAELTTALQVAELNGDAAAKASIQSDFRDLQASYKDGMEALK